VAFLVLLVILYVLVCVFLILVVLLQQGKGADLAGAFGGGGSQTSFGPRSTTNIMHRLTTVSFVLFVVLSVALAIVSGKRHGSSAIDNLEPATAVEETVQELPAGEEEGSEAEAEAPAAMVAPEPEDDGAPAEPEG
jgi:preprotein translocase subunit SecG